MPSVIFVVFQSDLRANGGVESITQLLTYFKEESKIVVVTQFETPHSARWRSQGLTTVVWPLHFSAGVKRRGFKGLVLRLWDFARFNVGIARLARRHRARIVHCNDILAVHLAGWGAKIAGAKVVHNLRGMKRPGAAYGWRWRIAGRLADVTLTLSAEMARAAEQRFLPRGMRSPHIYSIVDPDMRPPTQLERGEARRRLKLDGRAAVVTMIAALVPLKAQAVFIDRCAPGLCNECILAFVGDGEPSYETVCRTAAQGWAGAIRFVGHTAQVRDWYWASDVVVLASQQEGLARCMIESLACGTPVVSFDVCSAREILEGYQCGAVVKQGDYEALTQTILALVRDRKKCQALGASGAQMAKELFEPQRVAAQYRNLYGEILERSKL